MHRYYSFDIFDTLVTRKVGSPKHIFLITGMLACEKEKLGIDPKIFVNERIQAQQDLSDNKKRTTIHDIYRQLSKRIGISPELSKRILELELKAEFNNLVPIESNVSKAKQLRKKGDKIVYISDMYLTTDILKKILRNAGVYEEGERIFVSCEYGVGKKTGKLFRRVMEELNINPEDICHFGNSRTSDVMGAEKAELSGTWFRKGNLNRYEKYLSTIENECMLPDDEILHYSRIAAASRLSRLSDTGRNEKSKQIFDIGSSIAGPVLLKFVIDTLQKAKGKRIYFVARDGYILYKIAQLVIKAHDIEADIRYLYVSREAIILSMLGGPDGEKYYPQLSKIFSLSSVINVLKKLKVQDESIINSGISEKDLERQISTLDRDDLKQIIFNDIIYSDILKESNRRKERLMGYLEEVGMLDGHDIALVDVGWNLTIHDLLAEFLSTHKIVPDGYYFGINNVNCHVDYGVKTGFMYDKRKGDKGISIGSSRIIEVFCSAPHGKTMDYHSDGKTFKPIFKDYESKYLIRWGVRDLEEGILSFVRSILQFNGKLMPKDPDQDILKELIKLFWEKPTKQEVLTWGAYPFSIASDESWVRTLYKKISLPKLLFINFKDGKLPYDDHHHWPNASLYMVSLPSRIILKSVKILNNMLLRSRIKKYLISNPK